jgi:hypothetical protein
MAQSTPLVVTIAAEGIVDEAVVRRLICEVGAEPGRVYGRNGKDALRKRMAAYNRAAQFEPWMVQVDLDGDADCAPLLRAAWLNSPARFMCFRIAVREVEAWLFADRANLASFLGVPAELVPRQPEAVDNPKQQMVNLARRSRRREIVEDMVPRPASRRLVGPAYSARLIEFAATPWQPMTAARQSESLQRAIGCLQRLVHASANSAINA